MTLLTPLQPAEYPGFLEAAVASYAHDNVASGRWKADEAPALARAETERLLSDGLATAGHFVHGIRLAPDDPPIGFLWFATLQRGSASVAFVYQLFVRPEHRRQGHARAALLAAERLALASGHSAMALNVFASNPGALALYRSVGYDFTSHNMAKPIGPATGG